jgi:hypothetical protein
MTDHITAPISTRNLDRYGSAELPWSRRRDLLASDTPRADLTFFVATVRPDGRPRLGNTYVAAAARMWSAPTREAPMPTGFAYRSRRSRYG